MNRWQKSSEFIQAAQVLAKIFQEKAYIVQEYMIVVDHFLSHRVHPSLMEILGKATAHTFLENGIDVDYVLTCEVAGIPYGYATSLALNKPLVYVRKKVPSLTMDDFFSVDSYSYTKQVDIQYFIGKNIIEEENARILFVDDFLGIGSATISILELMEFTKGKIVGISFLAEKPFLEGRTKIEARLKTDIPIFSFLEIDVLKDKKIRILSPQISE